MQSRQFFRSVPATLGLAIVLAVGVSMEMGAAEDNPELVRAQTLNTQMAGLYQSGRLPEAIPLATEALAIHERLLGADHPQTVASVNSLAILYRATGDNKRAAPLFERVLAICNKLQGADHPDTVTTVENLAAVYKKAGEYAKAEPLLERAMASRERISGVGAPDTASSVNNLAVLYISMGAYAKAEPLLTRALAIVERASGVDSPETADYLNNLAELYRNMGAYAKAEPVSLRALALVERVSGADSAEVAINLNNLAELYRNMGAYPKAEALFLRALAIRERALGADHLDTASSLDNLATLYRDTGAYAKAEPLALRALAIRERTAGADHPDTAVSLNNLAGLYRSQGSYAKAAPLYERALAIREKVFGADHPDTAESVNNLAAIYQSLGEYAKARPLFLRALEVSERLLGADHPDTASRLNNLAALELAMGNYAKAGPLYQRALAIRERVLGAGHPATAVSLSNLAALYDATGDYAKAEPLYQRALAIREKALGLEHPDTSTSVNNLAVVYASMGNYRKAEPLLLRALAVSEKSLGAGHPETATSVSNLAELYSRMGDLAKAEPLLVRALEISEKALGADHPDTATRLNNLAGLFRSRGNYAKAVELCSRALAIRERAFGADHPDVAGSLNTLAAIYSAAEDYAKAEPLYTRALAIREKVLGAGHPETATSLSNLAFLQIDLGRPESASALAERAGLAEEHTLANVLSFSSEQQRSEFQATQFPYNLPATLGQAPLIALTMLHWKGVVLDSVLEDRAVARAAGEKGLNADLETMKALQAQLLKLTLEAPADTSEAGLRAVSQQRAKLSAEVENREAALARKVSALGQSRRALGVSVAAVQAALGRDEALVEWIRYSHYLGGERWERRYGAVIFGPQGAVQWVVLGAAQEIEKAVRLYQKSARGKTDATALQASLHGLHAKIWAPVEKALPAKTTSVILSPDAELNFVSFATLLDGEDRFLGEKYALRYVSSGRDLLRAAPKQAALQTQRPVELFGNPEFLWGGAGSAGAAVQDSAVGAMRAAEIRDFHDVKLLPLAGTAAECGNLAKMVQQNGSFFPEVRTGADASEAAFQTLDSPRILHLATHGFFLPEIELGQAPGGRASTGALPKGKLVNPMHRSGLALAGAQRTLEAWSRGEVPPAENDGILTAAEVGTLHLSGTWLVTLSACETGSGQARAGEGVLGLRRGFIQAGAENLLMTLWPVSDEITVKIMLEFYASAFAGKAPPRALAEVQRKWLVELRREQGLQAAVNLAGPFIMSSQGQTRAE